MKSTFKSWMQLNESDYPGHVGIWWADKGEFFMNENDVEDGRDHDGIVHSYTNHQKAWRSAVLTTRPDLANFSYTYLPRGRIYCEKSTKIFMVVGTPDLIKLPRFLAELKKKFDIKELKVSTEADDHYTGEMSADNSVLTATVNFWK